MLIFDHIKRHYLKVALTFIILQINASSPRIWL